MGTKELYSFFKNFGDIKIQVQFSPPHETAKSNRKLWTFVQKRWVHEPMILAAIRDGFQNTLLHGEYPIGAIFIDVPKDFVDVNVHPTKSKVKFKEQSQVYKAIRHSLLEFVETSPWRKEFLHSKYRSMDFKDRDESNRFDGYILNEDSQSGFELKAFRSSISSAADQSDKLYFQNKSFELGFLPSVISNPQSSRVQKT